MNFIYTKCSWVYTGFRFFQWFGLDKFHCTYVKNASLVLFKTYKYDSKKFYI